MKRNSILLAIFGALLTFTYFYEELGGREESERREREGELFSSSEFGILERVTLPNAELHLAPENGTLLIGPEQIRGDQTKVQRLLEVLGGLKVESELPLESLVEEEKFFGKGPLALTFKFEMGEIKFVLGKKLDVAESFYVLVTTPKEKKFAIVKDASPREGLYWKEEHNSSSAYLKLSEWLLRDNAFFYNLNLVPGELSLARVEISNLRNRPFALDYEALMSEPPPPPGITISKTAFAAFEQMLGAMKGVKAISLKANTTPEELLATMVLESRSGQRAVWEIFRRYEKKLGPYLLMKGDRLLYQMGSNELRAFFSNVQEFWDLRVLPEGREDQVITLKIKGESAKVRFPGSLKPYFFNQAERLSVKSADDDVWAGQFQELLQVDYEGTLFSVKLFERELMVENTTKGLRYYYRIGETLPFAVDLKNYQAR